MADDKTMKIKCKIISKIAIGMFLNIFLLAPVAKSADQLSLVNGIFSRTISIDSLDDLAKTGKAKGRLKNLLKLSNQSPEKISELLNQEFDLPLTVTSKLLHSTIGEVIITRLAKIIYPLKLKNNPIRVPAIRAGVINGIVIGKGKLTMVQFLKSYPNKNVSINIGALSKILNKAETMSELITFFSDSPLEGIQKGEN